MRTASAFSLSSFSIHNIRSSLRMDSEACASSSRSWVLASASLVNLDVSSSTRDVSSAILVTSCIFKASSLLRSELISISAASLLVSSGDSVTFCISLSSSSSLGCVNLLNSTFSAGVICVNILFNCDLLVVSSTFNSSHSLVRSAILFLSFKLLSISSIK